MFAKILLLTLLIGCNHTIPQKIVVPKPLINEIVFDFREVKANVIDNRVCFSKDEAEKLLYNIAMSRVYFNQSQMNLKLTQNYYDNIINNLGAVEK